MNSAELGTVFVTGASSGFGAVIARRFAAVGARVVATARRAERLKCLAAELGPLVLPVMLDVRDRAAVTEVLVNNAGLALGLNPAHYPYPGGNAYGGTKALEQHIIPVLTRAAAGAGRPAPRVIVTVPVRV